MEYAVICFGLVFIAVISANWYVRAKREQRWAKLKARWGRPKDEVFNFDLIDRFARSGKPDVFHRLTDQTLHDIDFYDLFRYVDRTTSSVGQQYLFHVLTHPSGSVADLKRLREEVTRFKTPSDNRDRILRELSRLANTDAYFITVLLEKQLSRPKWFYLPLLSVVSFITLLTAGFVNPAAWAFALIPLAANILLHYWNKGNTFQVVRSFRAFPDFVGVAAQIRNEDKASSPEVDEALRRLRPVMEKLPLVNVIQDTGVSGELAQIGLYLVELLKAAFLVEFYGLFYLLSEFEGKREDVLRLFEFVGRTDVTLSIASLMSGSDQVVFADVSNEYQGLSGSNLRNPMISACTPNSVEVNTKGILITGSNMAGKTTFLRTVLINSLLAQTLCVCFAAKFSSPVVKQCSSIRLDDNLAEGKSYFLEEVETVRSLLRNGRQDGKCLIVLDEVFKGTNTIERIAAAKAVLSYLITQGHFVFVSTHDTELIGLLSAEYDLYHFVEEIIDGELRFDHRLKPGPLRTRNAINILELSGYPAAVVLEAKEISRRLLAATVPIPQNTHSKNL